MIRWRILGLLTKNNLMAVYEIQQALQMVQIENVLLINKD